MENVAVSERLGRNKDRLVVFISYSRHDLSFAERLVSALTHARSGVGGERSLERKTTT